MDFGLILLGRSEERLAKTCRELKNESGSTKVETYKCDLSLMRDVFAAADRIKADHGRIDVLINNAGARFLRHYLTVEGLELTLATNHLGHFVLTLSLVDRLKISGHGRIINVSSGAHFSGTGVIENILSAHLYDGRTQYANSKLANILITYALSDRLKGQGITVNAVDPGGVATNFARNNGWVHWLKHRVYYSYKGRLLTPQQGAETLIFLASSSSVSNVTSRYFEGGRESRSSDLSYDQETQQRLWAMSAKLSGIDQ